MSNAAKNNVTPLQPVQAMTPMEILHQAVSSGANVETLEKLMGLQERWERNQARKDFDAAVADAKAEIKPVARNREGHNKKRYADFAAFANAVDPIISKHGLSYRFRTIQDDKLIRVSCVLSHKNGHSEETTLAGPADQTGNKNAIQAIGSTLTYLQRYSLVQALGLAAADDDDGRAMNQSGPLSDEQAETILKLIADTKTDVNRFLAWVGAASISDIPSAKFNDAVAMLNAKKNKGAQS